MTIVRTISIAPIVLLILNCASAGKPQLEFEGHLHSWIGRPITAFVQEKGSPTRVVPKANGEVNYIYERKRTTTDAVTYTTYTNLTTGERTELGPGSQPPQWASDGSQQVRIHRDNVRLDAARFCRVILTTDASGQIKSADYDGNDCW